MSSFTDSIMQSMIASMDPTVAMQRDALQGYLKIQHAQVQESKGQTVVRLADQLVTLRAQPEPSTVAITAIEKLIHSLSE